MRELIEKAVHQLKRLWLRIKYFCAAKCPDCGGAMGLDFYDISEHGVYYCPLCQKHWIAL